MKTKDGISTLDQLRIQGHYEPIVTDTAQLAYELNTPQDTGRLIADFDDGITPLRDVGGMFEAQRSAILAAYESGSTDAILATHPEILRSPVTNLHRRVVLGPQDQPVGHNFFMNATGFINASLPWAKNFNNLILSRTGHSVHEIAATDDLLGKDQLLAAITEQPDDVMTAAIAVYLAGRSLEGERFLQQHYGHILEESKYRAFEITQQIGASTGLPAAMLERVAQQLKRTTFGSFDHLEGLVTSDNSGSAGDYRIGSLRIEVQFDGSVRSATLRNDSEARQVIAHEVHHAGSAQAELRCGLQANGQGLEANEGLTEYLAQLSMGSLGIVRLADGKMTISPDVPYRPPVFVMLALHEQFKAHKNRHFATLFNAYHGDIISKHELEAALDEFYRLDSTVTQTMR